MFDVEEDEDYGFEESEAPGGDPYMGLHAEAVYAMWHDPTSYDAMTMGPPYLPSSKTARLRTASELDDLRDYHVLAVRLTRDYGGLPYAELAVLLSALRAASFLYQSHHWHTKGPAFFSSHRLFEEIYNGSNDQVDALAEKAVGMSSGALVDPVLQAKHVAELVGVLSLGVDRETRSPNDCFVQSRGMEEWIVKLIHFVRVSLQDQGKMTGGLENLLPDLADKREHFIYLLKQSEVPVEVPYNYNRG